MEFEKLKNDLDRVKKRYHIYYNLNDQLMKNLSNEIKVEEEIVLLVFLYGGVMNNNLVVITDSWIYFIEHNQIVKKLSYHNLSIEQVVIENENKGILIFNRENENIQITLHNQDLNLVLYILKQKDPNLNVSTSYRKEPESYKMELSTQLIIAGAMSLLFGVIIFFSTLDRVYDHQIIKGMTVSLFFGLMGYHLMITGYLRDKK